MIEKTAERLAESRLGVERAEGGLELDGNLWIGSFLKYRRNGANGEQQLGGMQNGERCCQGKVIVEEQSNRQNPNPPVMADGVKQVGSG